MGDRCWLGVTTDNSSIRILKEELGVDYVENGPDRTLSIVIEEANYGMVDELLAAAKRGAVFFAESAVGGCYNAAMHGSPGDGNLYTVDCDIDGYPIVRIDENGANPAAVQEATHALQIIHRVKKTLRGESQ